MADIKNNADNVVDAVLNCKLVQKSTIYGFQGNKKSNFVKITLAVPKMVAAARRLIEKGEVSGITSKIFKTTLTLTDIGRCECQLGWLLSLGNLLRPTSTSKFASWQIQR